MNVPQLLEEVRRRVPLGAAYGTRWKGAVLVDSASGTLQVAAAARIDMKGQRREQLWCDDRRVDLAVLLRLTCAEEECPHAQQVRAQWTKFRHPGRVATGSKTFTAEPLMTEVEFKVCRHTYTARPARFPCFTPCPNGAHPPLTIEKSGFDVFEASSCLGGGITEPPGVRRPRIPTVQAAEAYVLARHLETVVLLNRLGSEARRRPGPATEGD